MLMRGPLLTQLKQNPNGSSVMNYQSLNQQLLLDVLAIKIDLLLGDDIIEALP